VSGRPLGRRASPAHPDPDHVSDTRVRGTSVAQPGYGWTRLLDKELDETNETSKRDRCRWGSVLVWEKDRPHAWLTELDKSALSA
jgi:hypothetical protein